MADTRARDFTALAEQVRSAPFHRWLGVELTRLTEEGIEIALPWREEFVSDPTVRYTHGGILAALIDLAGDYAVAAKLGRGVPTVDMRIDYHRTALPGPLTVRASVVKLGGTLATADARIFDDEDRLVASGRGVYLTLQRS
jgi:uncharacterized protein (TIGR00369 family)